MIKHGSAFVLAVLLALAGQAQTPLTILAQFNPSNTGGTCGIAYNAPAGETMVIGCSANTIDRYAEDGTFIASSPLFGESANDVDIDISPASLFLNGTFVDQGQLLLINGETDVAEIYALDQGTNTGIDTLTTAFGVSHVVGGSYHPQRGTFFLVQDMVPSGFQENRVAEVDAVTGDTLQTFPLAPHFVVNYGDLDISPVSGNLFFVSSDEDSSDEDSIAEFSPDGVYIAGHALPPGVSALSGIALDNDLEGAWVCNTSGVVFKLGNFPVGIADGPLPGLRTPPFPNPTAGPLHLPFQGHTAEPGRIVLLDASGRPVALLFEGRFPKEGTLRLDLSGLAPGPYVVLVREGTANTRAFPLVLVR